MTTPGFSTSLPTAPPPATGVGRFSEDTLGDLYQYISGRLPQPARQGVLAATSFPATPRDGAPVILTDSLATPAYWWGFQWNAAAGAWMFTGGAPWTLAGSGGTAVAVATLPNAGQYNLTGLVYGGVTGSTSTQILSATLLVAGSSVQAHPVQSLNGTGTSGQSLSGWDVLATAAAGDALTVTSTLPGATPQWTVSILPVALT